MVDLTPLSLIASRLRCHIHEIGHRRAAGSPASAPTTEPGWPPPRPDRTVGPRSDDVDDDRDERTSTTFCSLLAVGVAASASARSPTIQLASQPASYVAHVVAGTLSVSRAKHAGLLVQAWPAPGSIAGQPRPLFNFSKPLPAGFAAHCRPTCCLLALRKRAGEIRFSEPCRPSVCFRIPLPSPRLGGRRRCTRSSSIAASSVP
ncbi:uncharacterized protein PFL1_05312 [Pseudozyma flocculosa PF-1]|uniref:Uncharacterized protein n=1 Tax=Pseudozyma flocculosa PF-1 TaxID=1277687 RepID=A0A061H3H2_9BASI|nr:uncharacterized protein PFL1_05312 [Pseudozyma flocculosa PF-1]EPQ27028.1 hypothetical protein PFL1_05312 [Pseudozyma flocculosa PF-1]